LFRCTWEQIGQLHGEAGVLGVCGVAGQRRGRLDGPNPDDIDEGEAELELEPELELKLEAEIGFDTEDDVGAEPRVAWALDLEIVDVGRRLAS
jgi:hypothetical protein